MIGFYVSVIDKQRKGLLLGPYPDHDGALANVDRAKALAKDVDPDAHWFAYGTCKVDAETLPAGRLNHRLGLWPCAFCEAGVTHTEHVHDPHVHVGAQADRSA